MWKQSKKVSKWVIQKLRLLKQFYLVSLCTCSGFWYFSYGKNTVEMANSQGKKNNSLSRPGYYLSNQEASWSSRKLDRCQEKSPLITSNFIFFGITNLLQVFDPNISGVSIFFFFLLDTVQKALTSGNTKINTPNLFSLAGAILITIHPIAKDYP